MDFTFSDKKLELLYTKGEGAEALPAEVFRAFVKRVNHIKAAVNEQDLRVPKSVHYEKLKGRKYNGKDSMRLNIQWRLILSVETDLNGKRVIIHEVSNHYDG